MSCWWFSTSRWTRITLQDGADGILQTKAYSTGVSQKKALKSSSIAIAHVYTIYIYAYWWMHLKKKSGISKSIFAPAGFFFSPAEVPKLCLLWWASSLYRGAWWAHQWPAPFSNPGKGGSHPRNGRRRGYMKVLNLHHWSTCWYLDKIHPWNWTVSFTPKN